MQFRRVVFDLDGTLFRGSTALPHAVECVHQLQADDIDVAFLTNNSGATTTQLTEKLTRMGFAPAPGSVYGTARGMAEFLARDGTTRAFVIGEPALSQELQLAGVGAESPECVVTGICRNLTYDWVAKGLQLIQAGAKWFATNEDATYPVEGGLEQPGAGATVGALRGCLGREPDIILGKPSPILLQQIIGSEDPAETLVIGDRYETDILAARAAGCTGLLVLTGVSQCAPTGVESLPSLDKLSDWMLAH